MEEFSMRYCGQDRVVASAQSHACALGTTGRGFCLTGLAPSPFTTVFIEISQCGGVVYVLNGDKKCALLVRSAYQPISPYQ